MKVCFTSQRAFADGPAINPFPESDPANIAYALGGTYFSFYTLRNQTDRRLAELLAPYDLVIVELNVESVILAERIIRLCAGRVATYSEGYIGEYQRLSPTMQAHFVSALRSATINFMYWENYVLFYRALTHRPVEYLPYPYLLSEARRFYTPLDQRASLIGMPSGLAGLTRNGLATLAVTKRVLDSGLAEQLACWMEQDSFEEDWRSIGSLLFGIPIPPLARRIPWRSWLLRLRLDYRMFLRLKTKLASAQPVSPPSPVVKINNANFYRRTGWLNYLSQLSPARILVDLNNRETVGRNAMDCAALGIACVSTARTDMQSRLFPLTTLSDSWDIHGAYILCRRLLQDSAFYQRVVSYAAEAIQQYDIAPFRTRFGSLLARHPEVESLHGKCNL